MRLAAAAEPPAELPPNVEIRTLLAHERFDLQAWRRWIEFVRAFDPDIVHAWAPEAYRWAWLASRFCTRARMVVTLPDDCRSEPWSWRVVDPRLLDTRRASDLQLRGSPQPCGRQPLVGSALLRSLPQGSKRPLPAGREPSCSVNWASRAMCFCSAPSRTTAPRSPVVKDLIWAADMLKFIRNDVYLLVAATARIAGGSAVHRSGTDRGQGSLSGPAT